MMISQQLSPRQLNNLGTLLLDKGRYEDATRCFAVASKKLESAVSTHKQVGKKQRVHHDAACASKDVSPIDPFTWWSARHLDAVRSEAPTRADGCVANDPPRKHARRGSKITRSIPKCSLGRPLWIQSREEQKMSLDSTSLSATLLYNIGLVSHLMAIKEQAADQRAAQPIYRRALTAYKMAAVTMLRVPLSMPMLSPAFASVLHNMSQLHYAIGEHKEAYNHRRKLAHVLRLTCPLVGLERRHYETFYIQLLSIPKADSPAAAA